MNKKPINEDKAKIIADAINDPIQRKILYAKTWFPLERSYFPYNSNETEEEWADRKILQIENERKQHE